MNAEELELLSDSKYRNYVAAVDKALKNFEYSSEWADLISALGKLNKVLQNNAKYHVVPKKLTVGKRLAQCLHPALPSGVHRKALETYEIIFKMIGPKRLAKDLFLYSSGLFPLLANAAMSVKPALLSLYEVYYLPLGKTLKPGLQGLLTGVLPGLEEGSEYYDRTNTLLEKVAAAVEQSAFYSALWGSILTSPAVRLPGITFVLLHLNRKLSMEDQLYVIGSDIELMVEAVSVSVQDSSVLVQRSTLDLILFCFPFHLSQATRPDMIQILSAALHVVLRRDMSLNRRLYAWLLGKLHVLRKGPREEESTPSHDLKPFRILISLLDKPELGTTHGGQEYFHFCQLSFSFSKMRENKKTSELIKTANLLFNSFEPYYMWDYIARWFEECCRRTLSARMQASSGGKEMSEYTLAEFCLLVDFLLDIVSLETYIEIQTEHLPQLLLRMVSGLTSHLRALCLPELTDCLRLCSKILSKVQPPLLSAGAEVRLHFPAGHNNFIKENEERKVLFSEPVGTTTQKTTMQYCLEYFQQFLTQLITLYIIPTEMVSKAFTTAFSVDLCRDRSQADDTNLIGKGDGQFHAATEQPGSNEYHPALAAACQLFFECSSFPVYIAEGNLASPPQICEQVKPPLWLQTLMTACCFASDFSVQSVAISLVLDLVGLAQSVAVVSGENLNSLESAQPRSPSQGTVAVVIVPPLTQGNLKYMAEKTDFFKQIAVTLWNQLGERTPQHYQKSVELFYQLHNLVPSSSICEDVMSQQLMHKDKKTRMEAHVNFSVLWHITRDLLINKSSSFNRTFDRSLFIMLDSLSSLDGSTCSVAQAWLNQVIQRHDIARILEPLLLLLLHPKTQRISVQRMQIERHINKSKNTSLEEDGDHYLQGINSVDGKYPLMTDSRSSHIWSEDSEDAVVRTLVMELINRVVNGLKEESESYQDQDPDQTEPGIPRSGTSVQPSECSNEKVKQPNVFFGDSLDLENWYSCGEGEVSEIESDVGSPGIWKTAKFNIHPLYQHVLLYLQVCDSTRALHALSAVEAILKANPAGFVSAISTTSVNNTYTPQLSLLQNLLARHRIAVMGKDFYSHIPLDSSHAFRSSMYIEIIISLTLYFLRSYFPNHLKVTQQDLSGNRNLQIMSIQILTLLFTELAKVTESSAKGFASFISDMLLKCKVQKVVLHCLLSSIFSAQKWHALRTAGRNVTVIEEGFSEDSIINFSEDEIDNCSTLQTRLLKLVQRLIVLEHRVMVAREDNETGYELVTAEAEHVNPQQTLTSLQYLHSQPITAQGMFLSAVIKALNQSFSCKMHPQWIGLITSALPYMGKVLQRVVTAVTMQLCRNLDNLIQQYKYETGVSITRISVQNLVDSWPSLFPLLKDSDVTHKIVEAIGNIAGSSLEQTTWLRRNLEVKASPQILVEGTNMERDVEDIMLAPVMETSNITPSVYSVHALTLLAEVLAHLLDMVFHSDEKEKVIPLLVNIMYYVVPYLRNHSAHNAPSYRACVQLVSSLSGYQYTRRSWKKEAFDLFMDPNFFQIDPSCVSHWRAIIDHLMTHDKTTFRDLMMPQSSSLNLFASREAELEQRAMHLKRLAFAIFSSEVDQYQKYLPDIQERLVESLRLPQVPTLHAQVFLFFRVLLLRMSPQHLTSLWPTMITELVQVCLLMEQELTADEDISRYDIAAHPSL
uniref:DOP1 leucine zipper like protein A n=1 Tax=Callorhinchus milii TaxID=7868 RepID=A0A4W3IME8_CALMI